MPDIKAQTADGNIHVFPDGTKPEVIDRVIKQYVSSRDTMTEAGAAAAPLVAPVAPGAFQQTPESIGAQMQTSKAPAAIRTTAAALPVVGGTAGALLGAPAGGIGGVAGAALGAGGGEAAGQLLTRATLGEGPATSKEAAKSIGTSAAVAGALEIPGALLQGAGNAVLKNLAAAKDTKQVGQVLDAVDKVRPYGITKSGIMKDLLYAHKSLSSQLTDTLAKSKGVIDIDAELAPTLQQAQQADQAVKGVGKRIEKEIAAAKYRSGITGSTATPQQVANFQRIIQKRAFKGAETGPIGATAQDILVSTYGATRKAIVNVAPDADPILSQMKDIHAATNAMKAYLKGQSKAVGKSVAISAATHPRTTALASPLIPLAPAIAKYGHDTLRQYVPALP